MPNRASIVAIGFATLLMSPLAALSQEKPTPAERESIRALAQEALVGDTVELCDATIVVSKSSERIAVASVTYAGRRFCNMLVRVRLGNPAALLQKIRTWNAEDMTGVVRNLDLDGEPELVVPSALSDYEGGPQCVAILPVVYRCVADQCVDASTQFGEFYRRLHDDLMREVPVLQTAGPSSPSLPCRIMERDKIERLLGTNALAGFQTAEVWMKDPDPILRRKAASVFADIGTSEARQRLVILSNDLDPVVSNKARSELRR